MPRANCLTRALATQRLLLRAGYTPQLRIGFRQGGGGELQAHAWIENSGEVVIGGGDLERFVALPLLERQ